MLEGWNKTRCQVLTYDIIPYPLSHGRARRLTSQVSITDLPSRSPAFPFSILCGWFVYKPDLLSLSFRRREQKWPDLIIKLTDALIMGQEDVLYTQQASFKLGSADKGFAHFDECPHDEDAHLDGCRAVQHGCGHNGPVLGENAR
jgi:hypothetical protein